MYFLLAALPFCGNIVMVNRFDRNNFIAPLRVIISVMYGKIETYIEDNNAVVMWW